MSDNFAVQIGLTVVVIIMMIPGLIIEPGPISEIVGIGVILAIWGFDDAAPN